MGDLGANLVFNTAGFYLLYYQTDISLLVVPLAGLVLTVVRVFDALIDPVVGFLSDRTRSRWGVGGHLSSWEPCRWVCFSFYYFKTHVSEHRMGCSSFPS